VTLTTNSRLEQRLQGLEMLEQYITTPKTFGELSKEIGYSGAHINRICREAIDTLRWYHGGTRIGDTEVNRITKSRYLKDRREVYVPLIQTAKQGILQDIKRHSNQNLPYTKSQ